MKNALEKISTAGKVIKVQRTRVDVGKFLRFFLHFQTCASNMVRNNDGIVSLFSGNVRTHENLVAVSRKHENFFPSSLSIVNAHVGATWHMVWSVNLFLVADLCKISWVES